MKIGLTKEKFEDICQKYDLIGASLYFIDKSESIHYQYGYSDKERKELTTKDTIYRIASISKSVLALGTMKLVEKGLLNLDEDISSYLGFKVRNPKYPDDLITMRMIMTQTSSITDGFDDEEMTNETRVDGYNGLNGRKLNVPLKTVLVPNDSIYYSDLTFDDHKPGTNFIYSNFGCGIMACVIEKLANQNYDDFMKEHVFDKLHLDASYYAYNIKNQDAIATLYREKFIRTGKSFVDAAYRKAQLGESYLGPAGGLFISVLDLAKIMQSFWKEEYRLLEEETIKMMLTTNWVGLAEDYTKKALQLQVLETIVPIDLYGHFGSAYGLRSMMFFNKELETGVIFITNGGNINDRIKKIPAVHYEILTSIWGEKE